MAGGKTAFTGVNIFKKKGKYRNDQETLNVTWGGGVKRKRGNTSKGHMKTRKLKKQKIKKRIPQGVISPYTVGGAEKTFLKTKPSNGVHSTIGVTRAKKKKKNPE